MESASPKQPDKPIRILLLDEASLFRATLGRVLRSQADFEVTTECGSTSEALDSLRNSTADVVLSDIGACSKDDGNFVSAAREAGYQGRFLIIAGSLEGRQLAIALKQGVSGIVVKSDELSRLLSAIRRVANGELWVDRQVIAALVDCLTDRCGQTGQADQNLSKEERERNVLRGILAGLSNRKIATSLALSESSVKYIVQRLFAAAGVKTRGQLVRAALERSLASRERDQLAENGVGGQSNE